MEHRNEASDVVHEFIERKRLAKLGLTSDLGRMPAWKCDAFLVIDGKLDDLAAKDSKKGK